jgi:indole-3-glycerol phosphate synthase / phosphoribosylanthranilate isomerase
MALPELVAWSREALAERMQAAPLDTFRAGLEPSDRSLEQALLVPRTGFILECKRASPSRGLLRQDFDPAAHAADYAWAADAISVITCQRGFQGRLDYLGQVRAAVDVPVLCKDFVVDPYQVYEARRHGADAILLMLAVLDDAGYRACRAAADEVGLDALTEVHDEAELERALALDARVIGVNNRDLKTLTLDLTTTERLAPRVPADRVCVTESGVFSHQDVLRLRGLADAFLVGSSLMERADLPRATRELVTGRFKVCGLTRPDDARAAWAAGATWGGLILADESPRRVDETRAAEVRAAEPGLRWVGVFVNERPSEVARLAATLGLSAVQLHGEEDQLYVGGLRRLLPADCAVWKAWRVGDRIPRLGETGADRLVLDARAPGARGGTGQRFDWSLLDGHPERDQLVLAGGLSPDNAAEADGQGTWALDVNSGVEDAPGIKNGAKLRAFAAALRGRGRTP